GRARHLDRGLRDDARADRGGRARPVARRRGHLDRRAGIGDEPMAITTEETYGRIRSVRQIPLEELYTSGHRTCQGCESATAMLGFVRPAGPRTIATGSTGCMYVANTSYMTTPWIIPWMHTQLGAGGSSAIGTAAGVRALRRKGKIKDEPINVISFCGDLGGGDMGIGGISAAL